MITHLIILQDTPSGSALEPTQDDFARQENIDLKKNNILTTLPLVGKEYLVSFELLVNKHTSEDWRNVIRLRQHGTAFMVYGYRIPGVWLTKNNKLHIISAVNGQADYIYNDNTPLKEGKWTQIVSMQFKRGGKVPISFTLNKVLLLLMYL